MKITQDYEFQGLRFSLTIESKTLETHSKMQSLSESNINIAKIYMIDIVKKFIAPQLNNVQLGRDHSSET